MKILNMRYGILFLVDTARPPITCARELHTSPIYCRSDQCLPPVHSLLWRWSSAWPLARFVASVCLLPPLAMERSFDIDVVACCRRRPRLFAPASSDGIVACHAPILKWFRPLGVITLAVVSLQLVSSSFTHRFCRLGQALACCCVGQRLQRCMIGAGRRRETYSLASGLTNHLQIDHIFIRPGSLFLT